MTEGNRTRTILKEFTHIKINIAINVNKDSLNICFKTGLCELRFGFNYPGIKLN